MLSPLFDLPANDHRLLEDWDRTIFLAADGTRADQLPAGKTALNDIYAYFDELIKGHRRHPGWVFIDDLIAAEEQGDALSLQELVVMAIQLVIGGYDTTANQIASGIYSLLTYRENWELLYANLSCLSRQSMSVSATNQPRPSEAERLGTTSHCREGRSMPGN